MRDMTYAYIRFVKYFSQFEDYRDLANIGRLLWIFPTCDQLDQLPYLGPLALERNMKRL